MIKIFGITDVTTNILTETQFSKDILQFFYNNIAFS